MCVPQKRKSKEQIAEENMLWAKAEAEFAKVEVELAKAQKEDQETVDNLKATWKATSEKFVKGLDDVLRQVGGAGGQFEREFLEKLASNSKRYNQGQKIIRVTPANPADKMKIRIIPANATPSIPFNQWFQTWRTSPEAAAWVAARKARGEADALFFEYGCPSYFYCGS